MKVAVYLGVAVSFLCCTATSLAQQASANQGAMQNVNEARFYIRAYEVHNNSLLSPLEVETAVYAFTGPDRVAADVELARAALQRVFETKAIRQSSCRYRNKAWPAASFNWM